MKLHQDSYISSRIPRLSKNDFALHGNCKNQYPIVCSAANVSIVKRALVKKGLIEVEKQQVVIPDPVMKVWLKKELGI